MTSSYCGVCCVLGLLLLSGCAKPPQAGTTQGPVDDDGASVDAADGGEESDDGDTGIHVGVDAEDRSADVGTDDGDLGWDAIQVPDADTGVDVDADMPNDAPNVDADPPCETECCLNSDCPLGQFCCDTQVDLCESHGACIDNACMPIGHFVELDSRRGDGHVTLLLQTGGYSCIPQPVPDGYRIFMALADGEDFELWGDVAVPKSWGPTAATIGDLDNDAVYGIRACPLVNGAPGSCPEDVATVYVMPRVAEPIAGQMTIDGIDPQQRPAATWGPIAVGTDTGIWVVEGFPDTANMTLAAAEGAYPSWVIGALDHLYYAAPTEDGYAVWHMPWTGGALLEANPVLELSTNPWWKILDLTVRPDGMWMSYGYGGKLYLSTAGQPSSLGSDKDQPGFHPGPDLMAYRKATGIFQAQLPDGAEPELVADDPGSEGHPSWSLDGSRMIYTSTQSGHPEIWSKHLGSGQRTQLTGGAVHHGTVATESGQGLVVIAQVGDSDVYQLVLLETEQLW